MLIDDVFVHDDGFLHENEGDASFFYNLLHGHEHWKNA